jgi:iron complex outermembrane receptor protein
LDFGFARNRINGSIDIYKRKTKDLLNTVPVAAGTNLTNYLLMNVGDMENKGIEGALNVVPIEKKDLRWEIGVNVSYNKNEITRLTASDDPSYPGVETGGISGGVGNNIQIQKVGNPINSFYVFQQVYDEAGKPLEGVYVDRNHDGQITDDDRYVYYKPDADVNIGLNTELSYKKWTLSASFRSSLGNYVYNNVASDAEMKKDMWTNNFISNRLTTARNSNFAQAQYKSDYYVQNASFLKLDKVTLAYNVAPWLRVNFTAQNVFTITNYEGVDPEVGNGIDNNMYPRSRNFILGASFNF